MGGTQLGNLTPSLVLWKLRERGFGQLEVLLAVWGIWLGDLNLKCEKIREEMGL